MIAWDSGKISPSFLENGDLPRGVYLQERVSFVFAILEVQYPFLNGQTELVTQYPNTTCVLRDRVNME